VPYKYWRYEVEQAVDHLDNVYGLHVKLTIAKAFQDIRAYVDKRRAYQNLINVNQLANRYEKALKINTYAILSEVFQMLTKYIRKQRTTQQVEQHNKYITS
jgi:hypothetical protein